jgi:hypothetical protein
MSNGPLKIAYLAEGKLYVKNGAAAPQLIESTFAQKTVDRATQSAERHGWRNKNSADGSPFGKGIIWGGSARMPEVRKVQITGLTRSAEPGNLLYALDTGAIGGLFTYDLKDNYENRLFHRQEFRANDLAHHPAKPLVALSLPNDDGTAGIAIMQPGGRGLRPITEGDARDEAPSWVPTPDNPDREILVYQSSGLARNPRGHISGQGPYAISRLDIDHVKQTTVLEDPQFDFLVPRIRIEDGKEILYFIRRPYKPDGHSAYTPLKLLTDILLFPLRLIRAIFGFLNFFSIMFSQKPLTTAGGPKPEQMDTRHLLLHGKWIDAEKALKAANKGQPAALVPASWELFRMTPDGQLHSLATAVLSFDLAPDGTIIYTNGAEVFALSSNEKPERLCAHRMIQQVMAIT